MKIVRTVAFLIMSLLFVGISDASEVIVRWRLKHGKEPIEIPVTLDYDDESGELTLKVEDVTDYCIEVFSSMGPVYSGRSEALEGVPGRVVLPKDKGEAYTIVLTDEKGDRYEGEFTL